ncbi:MAG: CRISPR-associated helicase Cas3' [Proteobacteria bacterium]|nr:CRISPR-associated helicase Cas3' [Pseudomonadota bacterium]
MSLFDIPNNVYSHPDYYPFIKHVTNIAESFKDPLHTRAAFFHDLGKLNKRFQTNIIHGGKLPYHSLEGAFFYLVHNRMVFDIDSFGVFLSILKHHGNLEDVQTLAEDLFDEDSIRRHHPDLFDTIKHIQATTGLNIDFDLETCCDSFDTESFVKDNHLAGLDSYFRIKETFSKLIFADKYEAIFKETFQRKTTVDVERYQTNLLTLIGGKENALSSVRNAARADVLNTFDGNHDKRLFFLEAPTGIGKTLTSLQLALKIAGVKNKKRIINALPMTSIIDQTHMEYAKIIDENTLLKFHHLTKTKNYVDHDVEEKSETNFFRQKNDFLGSSWGLDQVIVTTFNQILNAFYSNQNRELIKFWTLRDSVVIFDEIQAIPRILLRDFAETITFLSRELNMDFILMSATIPSLKQFLPSDAWCDMLDTKYYSMDFNNRYALAFREEIDTEEKLSVQIQRASKENTSVVCVVNTKKLALDLYEKVKKFCNPDDVFLLSTLFIPKHRKAIIKTIKHRLVNKQKTILVSTQVIEAGVDLDFDYGFREFSPLYSIIQTAGRVNRENREEVRESATLVVTNKIGHSPYHPSDLLYAEVKQLLETPIRENEILPRLKLYFSTTIDRTSQEYVLIDHMKQLEFESVMKRFDKNFMKTLPDIRSVFIEIRSGLYDRFVKKRNQLIHGMKQDGTSLEHIMEYKSRLKRINKCISGYVINICKDDALLFPDFEHYHEMKVCHYPHLNIGEDDQGVYSIKKGWAGLSSTVLF